MSNGVPNAANPINFPHPHFPNPQYIDASSYIYPKDIDKSNLRSTSIFPPFIYAIVIESFYPPYPSTTIAAQSLN